MTKSERAMAWAKTNPERAAANNKRSRDKVVLDPVRLAARRARSRDYYHQRRTLYLLANRRWREANPSAQMAATLGSLLRSVIYGHAMHSKRLMEVCGCTPDEFRAHLESKFEPGMSWSNYGKDGWTIGHQIACSRFDLTDPAQVKQCYALSNLAPEWAGFNRAKHNKTRLTEAQRILGGL